jgi:hypothetical protein
MGRNKKQGDRLCVMMHISVPDDACIEIGVERAVHVIDLITGLAGHGSHDHRQCSKRLIPWRVSRCI